MRLVVFTGPTSATPLATLVLATAAAAGAVVATVGPKVAQKACDFVEDFTDDLILNTPKPKYKCNFKLPRR